MAVEPRPSGGEQQRLAFARLSIDPPDIVIMDEVTSALDEVGEARMMELLRIRSCGCDGDRRGPRRSGSMDISSAGSISVAVHGWLRCTATQPVIGVRDDHHSVVVPRQSADCRHSVPFVDCFGILRDRNVAVSRRMRRPENASLLRLLLVVGRPVPAPHLPRLYILSERTLRIARSPSRRSNSLLETP